MQPDAVLERLLAKARTAEVREQFLLIPPESYTELHQVKVLVSATEFGGRTGQNKRSWENRLKSLFPHLESGLKGSPYSSVPPCEVAAGWPVEAEVGQPDQGLPRAYGVVSKVVVLAGGGGEIGWLVRRG